MKWPMMANSNGSFRMAAFGLGTLIYDGLEFGAFMEVPSNSPCFSLLRGLNPVLHAIFAFLQMYFIFVSARVRERSNSAAIASTFINDCTMHMLQ